MFDTLLIVTLFLLVSLLVCLLTLRLSTNIKHLCLFFHPLPILTDILKSPPPPTPHRLLNLTKISHPLRLFWPPFFIGHLRVTWKRSQFDWNSWIEKYCYFFQNLAQIQNLITIDVGHSGTRKIFLSPNPKRTHFALMKFHNFCWP